MARDEHYDDCHQITYIECARSSACWVGTPVTLLCRAGWPTLLSAGVNTNTLRATFAAFLALTEHLIIL